jgi:hypothetical protein
VTLEESDLVFSEFTRRVDIGALHAKVIVNLARIDGSACLGNQFGTSHGLPVPIRSAVQSNFDALGTTGVCWILERRVEVDIRCCILGTVL